MFLCFFFGYSCLCQTVEHAQAHARLVKTKVFILLLKEKWGGCLLLYSRFLGALLDSYSHSASLSSFSVFSF